MYTGFTTVNSPAVQVWEFFETFASVSSPRHIALADDCAPIQVVRTGGSTVNVRFYLPTCPPEGKQITIKNDRYGGNNQRVDVFASDCSGVGSANAIYAVGPGETITLIYSKNLISYGPNNGLVQTGWIPLDKGAVTSWNNYSVVVGGNNNRAASAYSASVGGAGNISEGTFAGIFGGNANSSTGNTSVVCGGSSNTSSGTNASVLGSTSSTASGNYAAVVGGAVHNANSNNSAVIGGERGTSRSISGAFVTPASSVPVSSTTGSSQATTLILGRQTTDATTTRLASDVNTASTSNQLTLPNNSAYAFQGTVIANVTGGGTTSAWTFEGVIKRGASAATTTLVAAVTPSVISQDAGASAWVVSVTADTTLGCLNVTVTGAAATTIRWVCKLETTEVTF